jgi:hypothetical protein
LRGAVGEGIVVTCEPCIAAAHVVKRGPVDGLPEYA